MIKVFSIALGMFFVFLIMFFSFAPEDRLKLVSTQYKRLTKDPGQACFDKNSNDLIDKKSAEFLESNSEQFITYVNYRAKNSFGTYLNGTFECIDTSVLEDLEAGKHVDESLVKEFRNFLKNKVKWQMVDRLDAIQKN
jgi:hypothetical protein